MGALQERIASTKKAPSRHSKAVHVPADDLTDPAPATTFAHLDATIVLERSIAEPGILSCRGPTRLHLARPSPKSWEKNITSLHVECKKSCSAIKPAEHHLESSAWTNFHQKIS